MAADAINVNVIGFSFTVLMCLWLLVVPRRLAALSVLITACYITFGQMVIIMGFHFTILRVVLFAAWIRLILRRETSGLRINIIDITLIAYVLVCAAAYVILRESSQALVNRLGFAYNVIGLYFFFRCVIRDLDDLETVLKNFAIVVIPLAALMVLESVTSRNLFAVFGGVNEITPIREGRLRCEGPFRHPILAGTFGATSMPLFVGLWLRGRRYRLRALLGIAACTIIVITSSSGGPLMSYLFGTIAMFTWYFRRYMRPIRWGILFCVIGLHMVMKAPVWYLMARINLVGGHGYHRSAIIDVAVRHFNEWWLFGTDYTAHWFGGELLLDKKNIDITNQYLGQGVTGGFLAMLLFIAVIGLCFRTVGRTVHALGTSRKNLQFFVWCLGASLFAHATGFLSVSYFDQNIVFYYFLLASISMCVPSPLRGGKQKVFGSGKSPRRRDSGDLLRHHSG